MNSYLANIDHYFQQQEQIQQDEDGHLNNTSESVSSNEQPAINNDYSNDAWMHGARVTPSNVPPASSINTNSSNMFIPNSSQAFVQHMPTTFVNHDYIQNSTPQLTTKHTNQRINPMITPIVDANGQPIRIRKKPGRKPNPASPALRKAQNRAAQRAFRERKERHLNDLEDTIRTLREQKNSALREVKELKENVESYKAEIWYLKGVVLSLQFLCMNHNIRIPSHSPYFPRDTLETMAQGTSQTIELYTNTCVRNNEMLKSTNYYLYLDKANFYQKSESSDKSSSTYNSPTNSETIESDSMDFKPSYSENNTGRRNDNKIQQLERRYSSLTVNNNILENIRQTLGTKITFKMTEESNARLRPTVLQLAIPHDPRIDIIPTPHTRDRMIIFRDQIDFDQCFSILLNGSKYKGGDPTESGSWTLPTALFDEFWYLTINYESGVHSKWQQLKEVQDISFSTTSTTPIFTSTNVENQGYNTAHLWPNSPSNTVPIGWDHEMYNGAMVNMHTLQPYNQVRYSSSPSGNNLDIHLIPNTNTVKNPETAQQNMVCTPESRKTIDVSNSLESFHNPQ